MIATRKQAVKIGDLVASGLISATGHEPLSIEVKELADGSGRLAIFTHTVDESDTEHHFRAIVDADGGTINQEVTWA